MGDGDWIGAHRALAEYFRAPRGALSDVTSPRGTDRQTLYVSAFPSLDARGRADRVLAGRYDLLGYRDVPSARLPTGIAIP